MRGSPASLFRPVIQTGSRLAPTRVRLRQPVACGLSDRDDLGYDADRACHPGTDLRHVLGGGQAREPTQAVAGPLVDPPIGGSGVNDPDPCRRA